MQRKLHISRVLLPDVKTCLRRKDDSLKQVALKQQKAAIAALEQA
jgi:hypothetical protein